MRQENKVTGPRIARLTMVSLAVAALGGTLGFSGVAQAKPVDESGTLAVSKNTVKFGESFTISGDKCTLGDAEVTGTVLNYGGAGKKEFSVTPDASGNWDVSVTPSTDWGLPQHGGMPLTVLATCTGYSGKKINYSNSPKVGLQYALKVDAAPTSATVGHQATVDASIPGLGKGQAITTQFLVNGKWSTSQSRTTDDNGAVTIPLTYGQNTAGVHQWRVVTGSGTTLAVSGAHKLTRIPTAVSVISSPAKAELNATVSALISVPGSGTGQAVTTQFWVNGKWSSSQTRTTNAKGQVTIPLTYGKGSAGTVTWRAIATVAGKQITSTLTYTLTRVPSAVSVQSVPTTAKVGTAVSARLLVPGVGAGQPVTTQFWVNGKWSTSQSRPTNAQGMVTIPLTYGQSTVGNHSWRAVTTIDGVTVVSRTVTLTRTR